MMPFHLAMPVNDITCVKKFYCEVLGCKVGRSAETWIDLNFFEHQLVFHYDPSVAKKAIENPVDGHQVPVPHFGVVLEWAKWEELAQRLENYKIPFRIKPYVRFEGKAGEQGTFFVQDPNHLNLEFKTFKNIDMLFSTKLD
jgi:extradiol dioxygenase family protein